LTQLNFFTGPGQGSQSGEQEGAAGGAQGQHAGQPGHQGERQELLISFILCYKKIASTAVTSARLVLRLHLAEVEFKIADI
jgi:hypothetical protein